MQGLRTVWENRVYFIGTYRDLAQAAKLSFITQGNIWVKTGKRISYYKFVPCTEKMFGFCLYTVLSQAAKEQGLTGKYGAFLQSLPSHPSQHLI